MIIFLIFALAGSLISRATPCTLDLSAIGVSHEESRFWARRARSRDAFFAVASALRRLDQAPPEVWDLLAVTRLGHLPFDKDADELVRLGRAQPGFAELEILLGSDAKDVKSELGAVVALANYGTERARAWLVDFYRVPARALLLAKILADTPGPVHDPATGLLSPHHFITVKKFLRYAERWQTAPHRWRDVFAASPLLAEQLIRQRFKTYPLLRRALTTDLERMAEWTHWQIAPDFDAPPEVSPAETEVWRAFANGLFSEVELPVHKQRQIGYKLREGEYLLASTLSGAAHELLRYQIAEFGAQNHAKWTAGAFAAECLRVAFGHEFVKPGLGARGLAVVLNALGLTFPTGAELRASLPARVTAALGESFREYFPLAGNGAGDAEVAEAREPDVELKPSWAAGIATVERAEDASASPVRSATADDALSFTELRPDREYRFTFAKPHPKFSGVQRVVFTKKCLSEIAAHDEVEPDVWLAALRRGIAAAHRQSGVKILKFDHDSRKTIPVHLKLILSDYGVTGEFCNGVWTFTGLSKRH